MPWWSRWACGRDYGAFLRPLFRLSNIPGALVTLTASAMLFRFVESRRFSRLEGVGSAFRYHLPFQRIACFLLRPLQRMTASHPQRSYALSAKTSMLTNSLTPKPTAAVTEPSLNAEPGCIKVVDSSEPSYGLASLFLSDPQAYGDRGPPRLTAV